jgi:hypothetical protein
MLERSQSADRDSSVERAVAAIQRYIAEHPAAADSVEGVAQWWLPDMGLDLPLEVVHRALDTLWRSGAIERNVLPDGGAVYGARKYDTGTSVDASDDRGSGAE